MGLTISGGGSGGTTDAEARALAQQALDLAAQAAQELEPVSPLVETLAPLSVTAALDARIDGCVEVDDPRLTDARTPTAHSHPTPEVTGLVAALAAKVADNDPRLTDARTPLTHTHAQSDVTGLTTALAAKANTAHAHATADVTGLDAALATKGPALPVEVMTLALTAATAPAAASAAANVELLSAAKATRRRVDLTNATQIRLVAMVIANGNAAGAAIKISYMTTEAATWAGTDAGVSLVLGAGTAGMTRDSGWVSLAAGARTNVTLAALTAVAFGTTAPTIGSMTVYVK